MIKHQHVDFGAVKVGEQVLMDIAKAAIEDIDGVGLVPADVGNQILEFCGIKRTPGLSVVVDKRGSVTIEVKVRIRYGRNIPDMARLIQDVVRDAVEKMTDIDLKDVHVNVQGVERGEP